MKRRLLLTACIGAGAAAVLPVRRSEAAEEVYRASFGDVEAVQVNTSLSRNGDAYDVYRESIPKHPLARAFAEEVVERSRFVADQQMFRSKKYEYRPKGKDDTVVHTVDDQTVRYSDGQEFTVKSDDILIDVGSLPYLFRFVQPKNLTNRQIRVISNRRVDTYHFGDISKQKILVPYYNGELTTLVLSAQDVNRPDRRTDFWISPTHDMQLVRMEQHRKKRALLPNVFTLELTNV